jgi:Tol biopolymer transport system component
MRRAVGLGLVGLLTLLWWAGPAGATVPEGPRLAFVELGSQPERLALKSVDAVGGKPLRLAGGTGETVPSPELFESPSWSSDGERMAFTGLGRIVEQHGIKTRRSRIYLVSAEGGALTAVPGTRDGSQPVLSPDGRSLAFTRFKEERHRAYPGERRRSHRSASTWIVDLATGATHRITPWGRDIATEPTSFSPDGSKLLTVRRREEQSESEIVLMNADGSDPVALAQDATDAVFSPDGSRLAYLRLEARGATRDAHGGSARAKPYTTTDLFTMRPDGSDRRRLTDTPGSLEVWPSWDPSGQRLAVTRFSESRVKGFDALLGAGDSVVELNADGSCPTVVLQADRRSALYGAAWQPGPSRGAGAISC